MKTHLDCVPCFFKQALEAAKLAGAGEKTQRRVTRRLAKAFLEFPPDASPPEVGRVIYGLVRKMTGQRDPYKKIKEKSNALALKLYKPLKKKIRNSRDSLLTAVELAIAGNIIDYGVKTGLDVAGELDKILKEEGRAIKRESKRLFNFTDFERLLKKAGTVLCLGDNSGEIVFDRLLLEEIKRRYPGKTIYYAVKARPIINDALAADAKACGMGKTARVISSGLDVPGTVLKWCRKSFLQVYRKADIIISKGQGNFEALSENRKNVFFLFMAKCPVVADYLDCNIGDIILLYNRKRNA